MKRKRIDKTINFTDAELFEIYSNNESLSIVAKILFGSDVYSCRERVKRLAEEKNLPLPQKKKEHFYCAYCGKEIPKGKKFCNHSCAASYNNSQRSDEIYRKQSASLKLRLGSTKPFNVTCKVCGKPLKEHTNIYCSTQCQNEYQYQKYIEDWKNGKKNGMSGKGGISSHIRRYLEDKYGCQCEQCGWKEVNIITKKVPLQIHHIDGDCTNNQESNLQLLCPNCHSLTETFGRLNKNSKRTARYENITNM